jgi:hypothetical protein
VISLIVRVIVFNATFNNISVIPWRSVLLVEETGVSGENHDSVFYNMSRLDSIIIAIECQPRKKNRLINNIT